MDTCFDGVIVNISRHGEHGLVPALPGVYALFNADTKAIYIGQSADLQKRYTMWRRIIVNEKGACRKVAFEMDRAPRLAWRFAVVELYPAGTTKAELDVIEKVVIAAASKLPKPARCLNTAYNVNMTYEHLQHVNSKARWDKVLAAREAYAKAGGIPRSDSRMRRQRKLPKPDD